MVEKPKSFREKVSELVMVLSDPIPIYMHDEIPMWLSRKPRARVRRTHERNLGNLSGGGTQAASTMLRDDDEDEIQSGMDGMTQLRGEASKDQDKFRITVEREQRCRGFCDDSGEPVFEPGATSVTFIGAHSRMSNAQLPEETRKN